MLLEINSKKLSSALNLALKIASKKKDILMTSYVLLETCETGLKVNATNYDVSFSGIVDASISKEGSICIKADKFAALVATYKNTDIILKGTKKSLTISYEDSQHTLMSSPVENFPKLETEGRTPFRIETKHFAEMMRRTSYPVGEIENKPHLSGINVSVDKDILNLIGSDSLRIAKASFKTNESFLVNSNATVPKVALAELGALLAEGEILEFGTDETKYFFKCGNYRLATTLLAQKYTDVSGMFIDGKIIELNRSDVLEALTRTIVLADKESLINEFVFTKDQLSIKVVDEAGESEEIIKIKNDEEFSASFRVKQFRDFLASVSTETVNFIFDDKKMRFVLAEPNSLYNTKYLIQPIRMK